MVCGGRTAEYLSINRGVPQGTVLGPILFSLMVNDISLVNPDSNLMVKFADDITIICPVYKCIDTAHLEVDNLGSWAELNRMLLNLTKTWEMLSHGKTTKPPPTTLESIERKNHLKLLGIHFEADPYS